MKFQTHTGRRNSRSTSNLPRSRAAFAFTLVAAAFALSACGKMENSPGGSLPGFHVPDAPASIISPLAVTNGHAKYSWIKANIMDSKCMDCHSAHQGDGDGLDKANFDSYEGVLNTITPSHPETSKLYIMVQTKKMPKGMDAMPGMPAKPGVPLNRGELQAISDWISSGAPNN